MKKMIPHIISLTKLFVVMTIVLSIVANGAFAGQRVEKAEKNISITYESAQLTQGPPSPDELPLNMDKSSQPETEQIAFFKAVQTIKTDNNQSRFKLNKEQAKQMLKEFLNHKNSKTLIATTSQVHSNLGRQFRLIGAKPSGTM